jgi:hypothetical protein
MDSQEARAEREFARLRIGGRFRDEHREDRASARPDMQCRHAGVREAVGSGSVFVTRWEPLTAMPSMAGRSA